MAYCTKENIVTRISEKNLAELTNDQANTVIVNSVTLDGLIATADAQIDAILTDRYTVPFSTVPSRIRDISVTITIYLAQARRFSVMEIPQTWRTQFESAIAELKALAAGDLTLPGVTATAADECSISTYDREIDFDDEDNKAYDF